MHKKLFTSLLLAATLFSFGQESCTLGTHTDNSGIGENISTGGDFEYSGAADFDVPFGTILTADHITFNVLKGAANLQNVNVAFLREQDGIPGSVIQAFEQLVPTTQTFLYAVDDSDLDTYQITVDLPTDLVFGKGKYFLQLSAAAGDDNSAWWEITAELQTYGEFDFFKFGTQPWGGTGYYNKVFQVAGNCSDSGEVQPNYGDACKQGNDSNEHENGVPFVTTGQIIAIADDFIVPENTTFHLTDFNMSTLLLGGGLHNATIKIRRSDDGVPGEILHSYLRKGPSIEQYDGYYPLPGSPFDVVSVLTDFSFDPPIELQQGAYFIEVTPTPNESDTLLWETTTASGIGSFSYVSYDQGESWLTVDGANQVFTVSGFCSETLATQNPVQTTAVQFYPNPVKDVLTITSEKGIKTISLYNIEGREITGFSFDNGRIDMQSLATGIYIVKAQLENGNSEVFKFVKE